MTKEETNQTIKNDILADIDKYIHNFVLPILNDSVHKIIDKELHKKIEVGTKRATENN